MRLAEQVVEVVVIEIHALGVPDPACGILNNRQGISQLSRVDRSEHELTVTVNSTHVGLALDIGVASAQIRASVKL